MNSSNVEIFRTFTIIVLSMMVVVSFVELLIPQNIYAQSTTNNDDSTVSTIEDLVKRLVTGVKLENITTIPNEVHVGETFEVLLW